MKGFEGRKKYFLFFCVREISGLDLVEGMFSFSTPKDAVKLRFVYIKSMYHVVLVTHDFTRQIGRLLYIYKKIAAQKFDLSNKLENQDKGHLIFKHYFQFWNLLILLDFLTKNKFWLLEPKDL